MIAIENVRLFQELKESLEQQTATSEILGVIASSPTDIQPVLDTVAKNAARLCEATDAQIRLVETDRTRLVASFGSLRRQNFAPSARLNPAAERFLRDKPCMFMIFRNVRTNSPSSQAFEPGTPDVSQHADDPRRNANWRDQHSPHGGASLHPNDTLNCSKLSPTKPSSPSRMCVVQRTRERNAELREAWSIRRQPPRCSASSAARPPTCSRCSMPSSRARAGLWD